MGFPLKSRTTVACPTCTTSAHILYMDNARQLGNWEEHKKPDGTRCPHSRKKALRSKYRGL